MRNGRVMPDQQHMRAMLECGLTERDIAEALGVHPRSVREVLQTREAQEIPPRRSADVLLRAPVLLDEDQHG